MMATVRDGMRHRSVVFVNTAPRPANQPPQPEKLKRSGDGKCGGWGGALATLLCALVCGALLAGGIYIAERNSSAPHRAESAAEFRQYVIEWEREHVSWLDDLKLTLQLNESSRLLPVSLTSRPAKAVTAESGDAAASVQLLRSRHVEFSVGGLLDAALLPHPHLTLGTEGAGQLALTPAGWLKLLNDNNAEGRDAEPATNAGQGTGGQGADDGASTDGSGSDATAAGGGGKAAAGAAARPRRAVGTRLLARTRFTLALSQRQPGAGAAGGGGAGAGAGAAGGSGAGGGAAGPGAESGEEGDRRLPLGGHAFARARVAPARSARDCAKRQLGAWVEDDASVGGGVCVVVDFLAALCYKLAAEEVQDGGVRWRLDHSHGGFGCDPSNGWAPETWRRAVMRPANATAGGQEANTDTTSPPHYEAVLPRGAGAVPLLTVRHARDPELRARAGDHARARALQPLYLAHAIGLAMAFVGLAGLLMIIAVKVPALRALFSSLAKRGDDGMVDGGEIVHLMPRC
ncbi:hypothetical protein FOA52_015798 [Chlamydomonas sp. UWO 241]|nr:hypothetical protein FOA52_015798 [Chlamydomonas sp. UWO 241]